MKSPKDHPTTNSYQHLEILIVDDDPMIRILQQKVLENGKISHPVKTFANGKEALDYLEKSISENSHFLVLLDLNMPVMNGWEFLEESREKGLVQQAPVVIVSSSINTADREKAKTYNQVISFCEKPFNKNKLSEVKHLEEIKEFF